MSTSPMSLVQFGQTIKAKHPEYNDLPDDVVGQRVLEKYPQYKDMVSSGPDYGQFASNLAARSAPKVPIPAGLQGAPSGIRNFIEQTHGALVQGVKDVGGAALGLGNLAGQALQNPSTAGASIVGPLVTTAMTSKSPVRDTIAQGLGVDATGVQQAAKDKNYPMLAEKAIAPIATILGGGALMRSGADTAAGGIGKGASAVIRNTIDDVLPKNIQELTGTTPERIAQIKTFPQQVEGVRQSIVAAEKAAHAEASSAFPKFEQPIPTGKMVEVPAEGPIEVSDFGEHAPKAVIPETTTWEALQRQRTELLLQKAQAERMRMQGKESGFDVADLAGKIQNIDNLMTKAAMDQGGETGLQQLQNARAKFAKYMDDFHNVGSAIRPLLEAKPMQTPQVIGRLLSPDGARALDTLRSYGYDTSAIQRMLSLGDRPVRVLASESSKLIKAGSVDAYTQQRIAESLSQAKFNEMPTSAQARLPQSAMKSRYPIGVVREIPGADVFNPRAVTAARLQQALENLKRKK